VRKKHKQEATKQYIRAFMLDRERMRLAQREAQQAEEAQIRSYNDAVVARQAGLKAKEKAKVHTHTHARLGSAWAGGRVRTPSRVPQQWGTTSCREAAPLTTHTAPLRPATTVRSERKLDHCLTL
jgi:hypothetical protein